MNNNNDCILNKIDFENKVCLLNMLEKVIQTTPDKLISSITNFNSTFLSNKLLYKINQYDHNGSPNAQVASSIKIIKICAMINIFKEKYFFSEENAKNFTTDINLLIHTCYKLLTNDDQEIPSKNDTAELDIISTIILSGYIDKERITYEKFKTLLEPNEISNIKDKDGNNKKVMNNQTINCSFNKFSYDNFQKYMKYLIKFYTFRDNFEYLFSILDNKGKIMTAELAICLSKLNRSIKEQNYGYFITKKFTELLDTTQIFLTKEEYYIMYLRSLSM